MVIAVDLAKLKKLDPDTWKRIASLVASIKYTPATGGYIAKDEDFLINAGIQGEIQRAINARGWLFEIEEFNFGEYITRIVENGRVLISNRIARTPYEALLSAYLAALEAKR